MNGDIGNLPEGVESNSIVTAVFAAPTSVLVSVKIQEVMPGQLIFLGHYLLEKGKELMKQQEEYERRRLEEARITKPPKGILLPR